MTTTETPTQHGFGAHTHGGGTTPGSTRADRKDSVDAPNGREENWRFTPMKRLTGLVPAQPATGTATVEVRAGEQVRVETLGRDDERIGAGGDPTDYISRFAFASFAKATLVTVPKETKVVEPVIVTVTGPGAGQVTYGHLQIRAERFAEAVVVIDYRGSGSYADNLELLVGDGARLTVVAVHDWADDAVHVTAHQAKLGRDATLRHTVVSLGGDLVRVSPTVNFTDKGGDAELTGLYFADAGQHLEHRLFVDHAVPNCRSNVAYKGALQGDSARTVWIGDVLIRAAAEGTQTYELNRNLVLTDGARADSVPNLEIETGEIVGAGHASTTGRFDDEQLFYLQARGIPEDQARRLVVRGFFHEILAKIAVPSVRERLEAAIEAELSVVGI
ncbi:MAG TPA: Fe-S cluster assembly protein SufD [Pseudonocardiaceae bacterium]|jgi:Fe-S cluster assembly protein SufD|nr:Fe-S cluster assembly protein SufD [Pseudonocardiaceae bacterium]